MYYNTQQHGNGIGNNAANGRIPLHPISPSPSSMLVRTPLAATYPSCSNNANGPYGMQLGSTSNIAATMMPDAQSSLELIKRMSPQEINVKFDAFLRQLDLPPDKIRTLRDYDTEKKRKLLLDEQQRESDVEPSTYLVQLSLYLERQTLKKKRKVLHNQSSTELLKHMEISLRSNSIDWVRSFLCEENRGLRILVSYLASLLDACTPQLFENATASTSSVAQQQQQLQQQMQQRGNLVHAGSVTSLPNGADEHSSLKSGNGKSSGRGSIVHQGNSLPSSSSSGKQTKQQHSSTSSAPGGKGLGDGIEEDVHVGVSCLRVLMNNKFGLREVMEYPNGEAIYCIVRAILHPSLRTKTLAIDLLSAICIIQDGHELIIKAFNRFQTEFKELSRFEMLFNLFRYPTEFQIDFMTACMKFINVLVHSAEDGNHRVALQYEFTCLGLDNYLEEELVYEEGEMLLTHVHSYRSNRINVDQLILDANQKMDLLEQVAFLEGMNSAHREKLQEVEADYIARKALLDRRLADLVAERDGLVHEKDKCDYTISTLKRDFRDREHNYQLEKSRLESRIQELEQTQKELQMGLKVVQKQVSPPAAGPPGKSAQASTSVPPAPPPPPPSLLGVAARGTPHQPATRSAASTAASTAPAPPAPPPPPPLLKAPLLASGGQGPPPPPPPNIKQLLNSNAPTEAAKRKRIATTKNKLPIVNWAPLSVQQVKGTVFNDINDEKLVDVLDLHFLEDMFTVGATASTSLADGGTVDTMMASSSSSAAGQMSPGSSSNGTTSTGAGKVSLLDIKRLQNIAITRRKLARTPAEIMAAVHRYDFAALPQDLVDILIPIAPTPEEAKQYSEYATKNNDPAFETLTPEDQFIAQLSTIERLHQKLAIMSFMAGFEESVNLIMPQLQKITAASESTRRAEKFTKVLEVVLAIGNAMNGTRRVPVYGFKLSSLDTLMILKSPKDRSITLMHAVAHQVKQKFPELLPFAEQELKFAEPASAVSMETLGVDIRELCSKFEQAQAERERKGPEVETPLSHFLDSTAGERIEALKESWKLAQAAFAQCAEYYGEPVKTAQPDAFFSRIAAFAKNFEHALADNEAREANERRQKAEQERRAQRARGHNANSRNTNADKMMDELSARFQQSMKGRNGDGASCSSPHGANSGRVERSRTRKIDPSDIEHGDFEKLLSGLNDFGYMAMDAASSPTVAPVPLRRRTRAAAAGERQPKDSPSPSSTRHSKMQEQVNGPKAKGAREVERERVT